jgi:hypothetical protein
MKWEFHRTHIKEDMKTIQGMSSSQPRGSQESTWKTPSRRSSEELEDAFRSTRKPAVLHYEELGGLLGIDPQVPARKLLAGKMKLDSY